MSRPVTRQMSRTLGQSRYLGLVGIGCFLLGLSQAVATDFAALCADRTAIEQVYYQHRLGTKPPFAEALPPATIAALVRRDLAQEATLAQVSGHALTAAEMSAEAARMAVATRAPDVLAELQQALANDPTRFGQTVIKPILVEKQLRERYASDAALSAAARRQTETLRAQLRAAQPTASVEQLVAMMRPVGSVREITWQLVRATPASKPLPAVARSADYTVEASVGLTATAAPQAVAGAAFQDLSPELQVLLQTQLQQPGEVSAVVESSDGFRLFLARERTPQSLRVAAFFLPKPSYELWLNQSVASAVKPSVSP